MNHQDRVREFRAALASLKRARAIVRRLGIGGADAAHARVFW